MAGKQKKEKKKKEKTEIKTKNKKEKGKNQNKKEKRKNRTKNISRSFPIRGSHFIRIYLSHTIIGTTTSLFSI